MASRIAEELDQPVPGAKICIMYARNSISELSPQLCSE